MSSSAHSNIYINIIDTKIDSREHQGRSVDSGHGASIHFTGAVRDHNHGKKVLAVSYDAYLPLARKELTSICSEAIAKWGETLRIAVTHRIGRLEVGDVSIVITVSAAHRDEAYLASRYIIEEIKVRVPIWKKEHYEQGETQWLRGHALCGH